MPLSRRSRFVALGAGGAAVALAATLLLGAGPGRTGPELAAPGNHFTVSAAASANGPVSVGNGVYVGASIRNDRSPALRDIPAIPPRALPANDQREGVDTRSTRSAPDTVVQTTAAAPNMPAATKNFDGIPFPGVVCNCAPPDTNGEAGATQYVQIVNEGYEVWNKSTGASVLGPVSIVTIWSGFGGVCQSSGDGDPVVLYDQIANRWVVSQFAGASVPTDECVAVSTTSDATGSYNRYDFHLGSNFFDYPHLAVWPDGYYMSMNVFNSSGTLFLGPEGFVFDRAKMLAGQPATFQTSTGPLGSTVDPFLPADLDGSTLPAANAPESFVAFPGNGTYQTYHYHVDWVTPINSTWTTFASPAAAGFTQLCTTTRACVPQLGSTSNLDGLADRLMFRLAYRNFGDHESVVGTYTVSSGGVAGLRWFELRNVTAGPETVAQESTYQPDSTWRWMGSAAMDHNGDIAIGFSASSSSIFPQVRYAGRLASDPLNTLGQGEATLFSGTGSQTGTSNRWGDYSDMTVDPTDDCTFWYTTEYYSTTSSFNWRTRIGSFTMPGCGGPPPPTGSIAGHVTDASNGNAAISGATVSISGGGSTTTDGAGAYSFTGLTPAGYTLTASATGYTTSAPAAVTVTANTTTTQDFSLVPAPTPHTTAYVFATGSAFAPGGDGNGYETNRVGLSGPTDGAFASDVNSGTASGTSCSSTTRDSEAASGYAMGTLGSTILGIQVQLVGKASSNANSPKFCVELSSDGGLTWTAGRISAGVKTTAQTFTLGTTADTWGRSWAATDFGSGFRVRIIDLGTSTNRTFYLDSVAVSVTYQ